jgi:hypothetical protein
MGRQAPEHAVCNEQRGRRRLVRKEGVGFKLALCLFFLSSASWARVAESAPPLWRVLELLSRSTAAHPAASFGGESQFKAMCTASCGFDASVSCSGSGSCTAVDQNCAAGQQGYVQCGSTLTYCPVCPPLLDCNQFNHGSCFYSWDPVIQCCVSGGAFCPGYCL